MAEEPYLLDRERHMVWPCALEIATSDFVFAASGRCIAISFVAGTLSTALASEKNLGVVLPRAIDMINEKLFRQCVDAERGRCETAKPPMIPQPNMLRCVSVQGVPGAGRAPRGHYCRQPDVVTATVWRMDNCSRAGCFRLQEFAAVRALQSARPMRLGQMRRGDRSAANVYWGILLTVTGPDASSQRVRSLFRFLRLTSAFISLSCRGGHQTIFEAQRIQVFDGLVSASQSFFLGLLKKRSTFLV
jgi:hypothetical protein